MLLAVVRQTSNGSHRAGTTELLKDSSGEALCLSLPIYLVCGAPQMGEVFCSGGSSQAGETYCWQLGRGLVRSDYMADGGEYSRRRILSADVYGVAC